MSEFLKKYWFVCLIAVGMVGILIYYSMELNKYNVSSKKVDGKDVVASTSLGDYTSEDMFDNYQSFNQSLLYYMYQDAVVNQAVEATSAMTEEAKTNARNLDANMKADASNKTYYSIISQLAGFGYEGENAVEDYCMTSLKLQELERNYVNDHMDEYKDVLKTNPKEISIITMSVSDPENLTEDEKSKQESIDKAIADSSFAEAATSFSEDAATAANKGYFGYADDNTTTLDQSVRDAIKDLKAGEVSDWITVSDQQSGTSTLYKVEVEETDFEKIFNSENKETARGILNALLSASQGLEVKTVQNAAKDLDITFENDEVKEKVESYIEAQTGGDSK